MRQHVSECRLQERVCWICYEGQKAGTLVSPCACRGDTKWVHSACLLTWIDEKQGGIPQTRVQCPQCTVDYVIAVRRACVARQFSAAHPVVQMPPATPFMHLYARVVAVQHTLIPFVGGIGTLLGGYICASSYGLYAIAQAVGVEEWVALSSHFDENPWQFYVGVPLIPVGLISTRFPRLEALLPFLPLAVFYNPQLSFRPLNPQTLLFALPYLRFAYNAMRLAVFETVLSAPRALAPRLYLTTTHAKYRAAAHGRRLRDSERRRDCQLTRGHVCRK